MNGRRWNGIEFKYWQRYGAPSGKALASGGNLPETPPESWLEFERFGLAVKPRPCDMTDGMTYPVHAKQSFGIVRNVGCDRPFEENGVLLRRDDGSLITHPDSAYASDLTDHYLELHHINHHA